MAMMVREFCFLAITIYTFSARADVRTDGTVGPLIALTGPTLEILKEHGTRAGPNLFHSFERFEVLENQTATFHGGGGISRIITRVTGPEPTRILGKLSSSAPVTDLYMINPNGIVIGPKAAITVDGSFHASTASAIRFPDGKVFSTRPAGGQGLSVAAPEAFGFVGTSTTIAVTGGSINAEQDIGLVGGHVAVDKGLIRSGKGVTRLVAAGTAPTVSLNGPIGPPGTHTGVVTIEKQSEVTSTRGSIRIEAGSVVIDSSPVNLRSGANGASGGIELAADTLRLSSSGSGFLGELSSLTAGAQTGGPIRLTVGDLVMDGGRIAAETYSSAKGADIVIDVERTLRMSGTGQSPAAITANSNGSGDAGAIAVTAGSIFLDRRSGIGGVAYGAGHGATVSVTAHDRLAIVGDTPVSSPLSTQSGIFALVRPDGTGDAGNISVRARDLSISHFGQIGSGSFGFGAAGSVVVNADSVKLSDGGTIGSSAGVTAVKGGSVTIGAASMSVVDGGEVTVRSLSSGPAGDLRLSLADGLRVDHATLTAAASRASGGNVVIDAGGLVRIADGGVTASAGGMGDGGNLTVGAHSVVLDDGRLGATAVGGNGGAIHVRSTTYHASADSSVSVSSVFGFDGSVRLDTPLFGRLSPTGKTDPVNLTLAAPILTSCDLGGRVEALKAQEALTLHRPLGPLPTAFPTPGERKAMPLTRTVSGRCALKSSWK